MTGTWAAGLVTCDVVTAAEFKKGAGAIYNTTLGAAAASIDVQSIVAGYASLLLVFNGRGDTAATSTTISMRLNNDSAANYYWQRLRGNGVTASAAESLAATSCRVGEMPAANAAAGLAGSTHIWLPNYAGAAQTVGIKSSSAYLAGLTTTLLFVDEITGVWNNSGAINRITLLPGAGNFATNSRLTIYALGA